MQIQKNGSGFRKDEYAKGKGTDSEKEEAWHEIGGGRISDSELLDSMDGVNLVRSILREKKDGNEWEDWSSLFISRKELVSTSLIRRTNKKRLTV
ncbi:hypothetical protein L1987_89391 [Smallanthus sonchifolius]|nr:hypothetical protein L1987_89391 [Smallanthus sonchifolius]